MFISNSNIQQQADQIFRPISFFVLVRIQKTRRIKLNMNKSEQN